ncbi:hypothetical protein JST97_34255 [bacterium]|nr:hypothetical protein [bacterium]
MGGRPLTLSLQAIRQRCPEAIALSDFEVEISSRGFLLRLTLPHLDVLPEGNARWGSTRQTFRADQVEQSSMWQDEDETTHWNCSFEQWVEAWLSCLNGGVIPGPGQANP